MCVGAFGWLDGCEVCRCDPCALVRPCVLCATVCVPCVSRRDALHVRISALPLTDPRWEAWMAAGRGSRQWVTSYPTERMDLEGHGGYDFRITIAGLPGEQVGGGLWPHCRVLPTAHGHGRHRSAGDGAAPIPPVAVRGPHPPVQLDDRWGGSGRCSSRGVSGRRRRRGGAGGEVGGDRAGDGSPGGCARAWGWLRECGGRGVRVRVNVRCVSVTPPSTTLGLSQTPVSTMLIGFSIGSKTPAGSSRDTHELGTHGTHGHTDHTVEPFSSVKRHRTSSVDGCRELG